MSGIVERIDRLFRSPGSDSGLRLVEVMRSRNAYLPDPITPLVARDFEQAKRRCLACNWKKLCDERLEAGANNGHGLFCPNSHYIEQLRAASLKFG